MINIFEEISKILPIYIIAGNHDCFYKNRTDVSSIKPLKYINNIDVIEEPEIMKVNNHKIYLMPWRTNAEIERECIQDAINNNCDYIFCHTEFAGLKFNKFTNCTGENSIEDYSWTGFKKVISGHIHWRQESKKVLLIGSPYQLNRGDITNEKGVYCLDLTTDKFEFFENNYSPKFIKIPVSDAFTMPKENYQNLTKNNFVDITYTLEESLKYPLSKLIDTESEYRDINFSLLGEDKVELEDSESENDGEMTNFNILQLSEEYVKQLSYEDKIKTKLIKKLNSLYKTAKNEDV